MAPEVFVIASLAIMIPAIVGRPGPSRWGALMILLDIPVYYPFRWRANQKRVEGK